MAGVDQACWVTVVPPCREVIYSSSRVHGNRTLGVVPGSLQLQRDDDNVKLIIYVLGIAFSQGVEKGSQDIPVYDNMYDNILYSSLMLQDPEDASLQ